MDPLEAISLCSRCLRGGRRTRRPCRIHDRERRPYAEVEWPGDAELARLYAATTLEELSVRLGTSESVVTRRLRERGLWERRTRRVDGERLGLSALVARGLGPAEIAGLAGCWAETVRDRMRREGLLPRGWSSKK